MLKKVSPLLSILFLLGVFWLAHCCQAKPGASKQPACSMAVDNVVSLFQSNIPARLTAVTAPTAPCMVLSYAVCNYFVPVNDYVTFGLSNNINLAAGQPCPSTSLNTVTITFEAAPTVPIFVWLQSTPGTTSTTPVYMTGGSITIPNIGGTNSWFTTPTTATMTTLCIQAVYPTPPPDTLYYPVSCTILYQ